MTRVLAAAVCILAVLLVAATFVGGAAHAQGKADSHGDRAANADLAINNRVETALARDAVLKKLDIKVHTRDGVVSLTGFVRSLEHIAKAGAVASAIPGVSAVTNDLRVANRPSRA